SDSKNALTNEGSRGRQIISNRPFSHRARRSFPTRSAPRQDSGLLCEIIRLFYGSRAFHKKCPRCSIRRLSPGLFRSVADQIRTFQTHSRFTVLPSRSSTTWSKLFSWSRWADSPFALTIPI